MEDTNFAINKEKTVDDFRDYIKQYTDEEEEKFEPKNAKEVAYSTLNILRKIQNIYSWVINNSAIDMRRNFIHNDKLFKKTVNLLKSHVQNKIRTTSDGRVYLKVGDLVTFSGDKDEYDDWVVSNKSNQIRLIRNIVDELNLVLQGKKDDDENKSVLNDKQFIENVELSDSEVVDYVIDSVIKDGEFVKEDLDKLKTFGFSEDVVEQIWDRITETVDETNDSEKEIEKTES